MIYTIKTVVGRENVVLDAVASKARSENLAIQALVHPEEIKTLRRRINESGAIIMISFAILNTGDILPLLDNME